MVLSQPLPIVNVRYYYFNDSRLRGRKKLVEIFVCPPHIFYCLVSMSIAQMTAFLLYFRFISMKWLQVPRAAAGDSTGRARVERQAVNSKIQGSASDILKHAMICIHRELEVASLQPRAANTSLKRSRTRQYPRMILQVANYPHFNELTRHVDRLFFHLYCFSHP